MQVWRVAQNKLFPLDRPRVVGIVNVTPDSFSDGGDVRTPEHAARIAREMIEHGADGIDIGAESTRPGAAPVAATEQISRACPAIRAIRASIGPAPLITIDTTLSAVAEHAIDAGADAINDVSAGLDDLNMLDLAARRRCGIILMHRLRPPQNDSFSTQYQHAPDYTRAGGVVRAVVDFLRSRVDAALHAGIARDAIVLDPGLGFGKSVQGNLELIARSRELCTGGLPILSAISRKSFTARAAGMPDVTPPKDRLHASIGLSIVHLTGGARLFRVHDVPSHVQALRAAWSAMSSAPPPSSQPHG